MWWTTLGPVLVLLTILLVAVVLILASIKFLGVYVVVV